VPIILQFDAKELFAEQEEEKDGMLDHGDADASNNVIFWGRHMWHMWHMWHSSSTLVFVFRTFGLTDLVSN
jgi:hypothetical protein